MNIRIKYGCNMTVAEFQDILDLDIRIFGNEILTNEGMALKRFLKFRDGFIAAYAEDLLMGFLGFFNVTTAVYERGALKQEYIDDDLSDTEIRPLQKCAGNHILLFDHVVGESFRHQGVSKQLVESTRDFLSRKHQAGYPIARIFSYAITPNGNAILSSLGGREIWTRDDITFFEIDKEIFLRQV
ncbi:hypothetical protein GH808_00375 [Acetobacterium fimetarium]|uniref:N-acetyltransferase domain-containing protein n=1 Tax=Acetobacterium fimetarium TaxID=52691 RepID=A0ABR6WQM3_9FIRM|nr:hypothetical protein [Acetobacterium fimetarium]MBC3802897.1 hypothetical protein [Acetobacterium fimetarium]